VKPEDAFIGIVEFFATLVPGAILAYVISGYVVFPPRWPSLAAESARAERWVFFLVCAYVTGHFVNAIASTILDEHVYDRFYVPWKRVESREGAKAAWSMSLRSVTEGDRQSVREDELFLAAKQLKVEQLKEFAERAKLDPLQITNMFWWAVTLVALKAPHAARDVDRLIAQSKLLRSLSIVLPIAVLSAWSSIDPCHSLAHTLGATGVAALVSLSCVASYCHLRWDSVERAYEYYIALTSTDVGPS
jgi:hypothetical protein